MAERILNAARLAVIVPIFRHSTLLSEAVDSILAQQADFEILLVLVNDGCPHVETDVVCLDYARTYPDQIVYLRKPNGGLSDARNHGIQYVLDHAPSVEAVYLLDADNRLRAHSLSRAMAVLEDDPTLGWVYPNIDMFGLTWHGDYGGDYSRLIHSHTNICEAGSLISRKVFEAGVLFDTDFKQGFEDWEFFISAGEAGFRGKNLENFGFRYRKRAESMLADSERDSAGIKSAMRLKHKKYFNSKSLIEFEQVEAPRYAFFLTDKDEVRFTTDPSLPGVSFSPDEYAHKYWLARSSPSTYHIPSYLVVTTEQSFQVLKQSGTLHWAIWDLEMRADQSGIAMLSLAYHSGDRIHVENLAELQGSQKSVHMVMSKPSLLKGVLNDNDSTWIDSLVSTKPDPGFSNFQLKLPSSFAEAISALGNQATWSFLSYVHALRQSKWRAGAKVPTNWRIGGIPERARPHSLLRARFDGNRVYPRVQDGRTHVGLTVPIIEFGGVEKVALNYARELKASGFAVHLFVLARYDAAYSEEWRDAVESITFFKERDFSGWDQHGGFYYGNVIPGWAQKGNHGEALGMLHWLDAVIDFHGAALVGIMAQLRRMGIRTASSLHLLDFSEGSRPVGNAYLALAYEHAFDVFAPCSLQLGDWLHGMGVPLDKITPVVNAPSFPISDASLAACLAQRETRSPDAPLRVMYLGRLDPQKGLEPLSQVVEASAGLNVAWRVIGKAVVTDVAQPISPAIQRVLEPSLATPEELIDAYAWADVVVLLSSYEGLPLTILEAMRQGVVCIATDVGAVAEALEDDVNGVVLPLREAAEGCLAALQRLSGDRAALRRLSIRAAADMNGRDWAAAMSDLIGMLMPVQKIEKVGK